MKFRFVGNQDCPDWILAEAACLSKLTSIKVKLLCNQVAAFILAKCSMYEAGEVGDQDQKQHKERDPFSAIDFAKLEKIAKDSKMQKEDMQAVFSFVYFVFMSAVKYKTAADVLGDELQQLGMPKESSSSIIKVYQLKYEDMRRGLDHLSLKEYSFVELLDCGNQIPPVVDVTRSREAFNLNSHCTRSSVTVTFPLADVNHSNNTGGNVEEETIINNFEYKMRFGGGNDGGDTSGAEIAVDRKQFDSLLRELKIARDIMKSSSVKG
eukprot:Nk52_evm54s212 gene=Nk52_evmTU54s212